MPADWTVKQGDTGPAFVQQLSYTDGTLANLAGAAVAFQVRSLSSAAVVALTGTTAVVTAASGIVSYTPSATDTATAGGYMAQWIVTFPGGTVQSWPTAGYLWVQVEPSLTAEPQQLVSLPDVKEYLGMDRNQHDRDHELLTMIEGMRPQIEAITGPILPAIYDEKYDGGQNLISLRNRPSTGYGTSPLLTLIAASEFRGVTEFPLALVQNPTFGTIYSVELDPRLGTVTRRTAGGGTIAFMPGRNTVHLVYQAGQNQVPANVRLACLEIIRVNFRTTAPAGRGRIAQEDAAIEAAAGKQAFSITPAARRMLAPTRRWPSFA